MADLDQLDQAALREEEEEEEEEEDSYDEDQHQEHAPPLPQQQQQQQQQQQDWNDSDREEIDVPDATNQHRHSGMRQREYSPPSKTTNKPDGEEDDEGEREIGLDELFASKSITAKSQAADLQELAYTRLYQAWAQESRSPELLPLDQVTLEALREAVADADNDEQEQQLQQQQHSDNPHMNALIQSILHIDTQRVKFLLADLLKLRLQKIQAHPLHMRKLTDRMSEAEVDFLREYGVAVERHLQVTVTHHFPQEVWKQLDAPDMIDEPDLDSFVFLRFLEATELMDKDQDFFAAGNCAVVRYRRVRDLFLEGKVELI